MKILIIGLGYAGNRYRRTFEHIATSTGMPLSLAYVGRRQRSTGPAPRAWFHRRRSP